MGSLRCTVQPSQSISGFHHPVIRPSLKVAIVSLTRPPFVASHHRLKIGNRLQVSPKLNKNVMFASNKNPPQGSDVEKREDGAAKGPPSLTILAGFLVFAAVGWVIGSIVMWLLALVVNLSPTT